jgi:hypothetical protein
MAHLRQSAEEVVLRHNQEFSKHDGQYKGNITLNFSKEINKNS